MIKKLMHQVSRVTIQIGHDGHYLECNGERSFFLQGKFYNIGTISCRDCGSIVCDKFVYFNPSADPSSNPLIPDTHQKH